MAIFQEDIPDGVISGSAVDVASESLVQMLSEK